jgi:predicted DNA-binding protein with PD1-like motif
VKTQKLHEAHGQRAFLAVLKTGDEAIAALRRWANQERLSAAQITAIGAFERAVIGFFDWNKKQYLKIPVDQQVEVASLIGDIAVGEKGEAALHIHVVLGKSDGSAAAGHLLEGHVRPTLEVLINESPAHLQRVHDPASGLALIKPGA